CEGPSCGGWSGLFAASAAELPSVAAANQSQALQRFLGVSDGWAPVGLNADLYASDGLPGDATWGFRSAGAALLGVDWNLQSRAWSIDASTGARVVVVGGTRHQSL